MKILVFNAGSSSLKFEVFEVEGHGEPVEPSFDKFRSGAMPVSSGPGLRMTKESISLTSVRSGVIDNHGKAIKNFGALVKKITKEVGEISAIGHRVVHGGEHFSAPTRITPAVKATIRKLFALAPLHNPPNLAVIEECEKLFPGVPQVAVFDTAFHSTMPEKAFLYGLPYSLSKKLGIRRFGFHGTSHEYVFGEARKKLGAAKTKRTITCHLGNGCSIAAIKNGKVIDTSMGFTPLEGIPMGTRSGDLDPAIIFFLQDSDLSSKKISELLHKKSGLLGVSELSSDMRDLWAAYQKGGVAARRTLEWFTYRIVKYIGAYATVLGGLDCLVFTGGIGEHAWYLRKWITKAIRPLLKPKILVIPTHEEKIIAEKTADFAYFFGET